MIEIKRVDALAGFQPSDIAAVLVGGFAEDFAYFSKNQETLARAFAHMIIPERFYVALVDGVPAAIASLTEADQECFTPDRSEFQKDIRRRKHIQRFLHRHQIGQKCGLSL